MSKLTKIGSRFEREDIAKVRLQPIAKGVAAVLRPPYFPDEIRLSDPQLNRPVTLTRFNHGVGFGYAWVGAMRVSVLRPTSAAWRTARRLLSAGSRLGLQLRCDAVSAASTASSPAATANQRQIIAPDQAYPGDGAVAADTVDGSATRLGRTARALAPVAGTAVAAAAPSRLVKMENPGPAPVSSGSTDATVTGTVKPAPAAAPKAAEGDPAAGRAPAARR